MIFIKRVINRLNNVLRTPTMKQYPYETCKRCGKDYRIIYSGSDNLWENISEKYNLLCLDCFITLANKNGIKLNINDFETLEVFNL